MRDAISASLKFPSSCQQLTNLYQPSPSRCVAARKDFGHKATTAISKNHAMVAIEDLHVGNTPAQPVRPVGTRKTPMWSAQ